MYEPALSDASLPGASLSRGALSGAALPDIDRAALAPAPGESFHASVTAVIEHLVAVYPEKPSLDELAAIAGLHPHHFQRVFKRWVGISPKRFLQHLTVEHAKHLLARNESVLGAALDVGLSGPSRLHDLFLACEAMTPGAFKARGRDLTIRFGVHRTPLGRMLIGLTERGVCWASFTGDEADAESARAVLAAEWPAATLIEDGAATAPVAACALSHGIGAAEAPAGLPPSLRVLLRGTNFELKVWQALLAIPSGAVVSYEDIAAAIGRPTAVRAVGRAIGRNPVSLLIPCHRVIRKSGEIHNYRWGVGQKRLLLAWEQAQRERLSPADGAEDAAG